MPSDRTQRPRLGQVRRRVIVPAFLQHEHTERDSSAASSSDGVSSTELQLGPQLTHWFAVLTRYVRKKVSLISDILGRKGTFPCEAIICRPSGLKIVWDKQGKPQICGLFSCSTASALSTTLVSLL